MVMFLALLTLSGKKFAEGYLWSPSNRKNNNAEMKLKVWGFSKEGWRVKLPKNYRNKEQLWVCVLICMWTNIILV